MEKLYKLGKFEIVEILENGGFSEEEIKEMFIYWLSKDEIIECVNDFLQDRALKINSKNEIVDL